jgi:hypothetical protein
LLFDARIMVKESGGRLPDTSIECHFELSPQPARKTRQSAAAARLIARRSVDPRGPVTSGFSAGGEQVVDFGRVEQEDNAERRNQHQRGDATQQRGEHPIPLLQPVTR